ncbi:MAG: hypothetical protein ACRD50_16540 [Candidatus Acidiferrales bacterium]
MKTRLNLATSPIENNRRFIAAAGFVGAATLIALIILSAEAFRGWRENREIRTAIANYQSQIRQDSAAQDRLRLSFQQPTTASVMDRSAFLNSLIAQRSFPWTKLFMDLERLLPPGVRVVSLAPAMKNDRVEIHLVVGALSDEAKLKFLKAMEDSGLFSDIEVKSQAHPTETSVAADPVQLELVAWYQTL